MWAILRPLENFPSTDVEFLTSKRSNLEEAVNARIEAVVDHSFTCSPQRVFESWVQPEAIREWMRSALQTLGLPGDLVKVETDPQVGGQFCFADKRPAGVVFHWGTYQQLNRPQQLAFTWNAGMEREDTDDNLSLVNINFLVSEVGCDVKLIHSMDAKWQDYLQRTENGWKNMLVHIEKHLCS